MTPIDAVEGPARGHRSSAEPLPVALQIVSTVLFGGFAIVAVAIAFEHFWPAGLVLAVILGWRGGFAPRAHGPRSSESPGRDLRTLCPGARRRNSGNASFDAYRDDVLSRLEDERESFENFLARLRAARDQSEFDRFMDARLERISQSRAEGGAPAPA